MLPNPYTPGQVPRVLAGRTDELARIRGVLSRVATYGELGGPLLVFHAPRGVGKTSLLREAETDAREHGFVTAWVACARGQRFLPELARAVDRALADADLSPTTDRWRTRLDKLGLEVGVPGAKVRAEMTTRPTAPPPPAAPIAEVQDLLHEAADAVRSRGGAGLVVFLDELHAPARDDVAVLLNALQNLDAARAVNPLAVIGAGLPSTPEELTRAATFGERSTFVELSLLDDQAAAQAITVPADRLGVAWDAAAFFAVEETAQGYPYSLQLMAHAAWQAAAPTAGARITLADVEAGRPAVAEQLRAMYRARWRAATRVERQLMAAMAAAGTEVVARSEVAARMGRGTRSISVPRDRLIDRGVIEAAGHGRLRFTLPGFADYVRAHGDDPDLDG